MATHHPQTNGQQQQNSESARPRKDTKVAVEDSETWVDAKRYTVYKVRVLKHIVLMRACHKCVSMFVCIEVCITKVL